MSTPFAQFSTTVHPDWVDYNGHMNDAFYGVVCTQANEVFLDHLGMSSAYRQETGSALYTVEAHLYFLKECRQGEPIHGQSVVESFDAKRLWIVTTLTADGGAAILRGRYLYLHVGPEGVVPFPADRVAVLEAAPTAS